MAKKTMYELHKEIKWLNEVVQDKNNEISTLNTRLREGQGEIEKQKQRVRDESDVKWQAQREVSDVRSDLLEVKKKYSNAIEFIHDLTKRKNVKEIV